ncbi:hypothetical protein KSP40_PGU016834 [Platanthera guangdongensis]|uniref:Agglutinin domain-containing protein n=1 Tax=Platanthera guangdongensis TaxID=2320717 RepID=A0ABR2MIX2_9ASPA
MSLPRFIALESAALEKFMYFVEDDVDLHGALIANGETIISPYAKFEVERARSGGNHVNIRSCYNNKYLTRGSRRNIVMICCEANEPQEDTSLRTCTLFQPVFTTIQNRNFIRLIFAFDGRYANVTNRNQPPQNFLAFNSSAVNRGLFTVSDWELLYIIPKYVTFKGDNEEFLSARTMHRQSFLQFASEDIGDPTVGHEVFHLRDGSVRLKSNHFGRFWRRSPDWILADSADTTDNNIDTVFWPIRVSNNVVALRNLGNNRFCSRLTALLITNCLNAAVSTISREARLEVHETVLSRDISNVQFRLLDARIYGENVLTMANGDATNRSTEPNTVILRLLYSETESRSFNSSVTLKVGVETKIRTGIPFIASGEITISTEFEGTVEWGSTSETTKELETTYTVTVPPMTAMRVRLLATQGKCDVPFSYTQRDTLTSGQITSTIMNDGVYTGANCFNFTYDTDEQPISQFDEPLPLSSRGGLTPDLII